MTVSDGREPPAISVRVSRSQTHLDQAADPRRRRPTSGRSRFGDFTRPIAKDKRISSTAAARWRCSPGCGRDRRHRSARRGVVRAAGEDVVPTSATTWRNGRAELDDPQRRPTHSSLPRSTGCRPPTGSRKRPAQEIGYGRLGEQRDLGPADCRRCRPTCPTGGRTTRRPRSSPSARRAAAPPTRRLDPRH